jgi:hypothetical protein
VSSPLDDARAKLGRAKLHVEILRADIRQAGQGEPYTIPLREDLDEDTGTLYLRVDRETARPQEWGLMIGDALHNLRSALDSGWWQLACHHLKRGPTEEEAKKIQFPILKPGGTWNHSSVKKWVGLAAAKFAGALQPDPGGYPPEILHPLAALNRLSNIDKHRNIHTTVQKLHTLTLQVAGEGQKIADAATGVTIHYFGDRAPKAGDKLVTMPADSWPRDPHMKFKAHQTGFVAIEGGSMSALTTLDAIGECVDLILIGFSHILEGRHPGNPKMVLTKNT